jgi:adenosylhomocysteine nucleosidase
MQLHAQLLCDPQDEIGALSEAFALVPRELHPVLAITGLAFEARLAAGPGVVTVRAGGDPVRLRMMLAARSRPECRAVISVGIAGGLDPALVPGDVIVATGVAAPDRRHAACMDIAEGLAARLSAHPKRVLLADLAGVDEAVMSPHAKHALRAATGALAVDMESHVAAAYAAQHGLPFAAVRVICDPAHRALPEFVSAALRPDGQVSLPGVLGGLMRQPMQVFAMTRLARDAAAGFRALRHCRALLGHGFGIPATALTSISPRTSATAPRDRARLRSAAA